MNNRLAFWLWNAAIVGFPEHSDKFFDFIKNKISQKDYFDVLGIVLNFESEEKY